MQLLAETNRLRQEGVLHEVRAQVVGKWARLSVSFST